MIRLRVPLSNGEQPQECEVAKKGYYGVYFSYTSTDGTFNSSCYARHGDYETVPEPVKKRKVSGKERSVGLQKLTDAERVKRCHLMGLPHYPVKKVPKGTLAKEEAEDRGRGGFLDTSKLNYGADTYIKTNNTIHGF